MSKKQKLKNTNTNTNQTGKYELPISIYPRIEQLLNSFIQKEGGNQIMAAAIPKPETIELFKKEDWVCLINFETISNGITINNGLGNGFFCKLNYSNIPFQKALFTNNHILNEKASKKTKKSK